MDANFSLLVAPLQAVFIAFEEYIRESGIKCETHNCVFNNFFNCHLRTVILKKGQCSHYNPNLTFNDLFPRSKTDAVQEDHKK